MQGLNTKLASLKKSILKQKDEDVEFRNFIKSILTEIFGHTGHVKEIIRRKNNITLIASNKIAAQELFLQREEILEKIQADSKFQKSTLTVK